MPGIVSRFLSSANASDAVTRWPEMIEFIRQGAPTYFHPTSTCNMGLNPSRLSIRSVAFTGLRAFASIMPNLTTGNPGAR